jgi:hypothetical protein
MLCFDVPADLQESIGKELLAGDVTQYGQGPFSLHAILMLHIVESFDRAVWSWRDVVRDLEKTRATDDALEKRSFEHMHETARHVIHCSEMLETAISVAESAAKEVRGSSSYQCDDLACSTIVKDLELSISLLTSLRNRSQALEKRLENEISLASRLLVTSLLQTNPLLTRNIRVGTTPERSTRQSGHESNRRACTSRRPSHERNQHSRHGILTRDFCQRKSQTLESNQALISTMDR